MPFNNAFQNKTVLVTGHTGFKGSWLCAWLNELGAKVIGISDRVPTQPAHFEAIQLKNDIIDYRIDIRNQDALQACIANHQPDFVFHLAAQPIVRRAYRDPVITMATNIMGTVHMLDALRNFTHPCTAVFITSDKAYENVEWEWGYREIDRLGGKDPYSASKGAAELVIRSFIASYITASQIPVRIAVGRAGNVIGGGDWAEDRLVPDCARAWSVNETVEIRHPKATRPWQHVLEPISGYLSLAAQLSQQKELNGEAFNFGPAAHQDHSVEILIRTMANYWPEVRYKIVPQPPSMHEAGLLKLNCDKALAKLAWQATLDFTDTVYYTADWYRTYYKNPNINMRSVTIQQIQNYLSQALEKGLLWAR